jgi:glycosyltransferase involved in cell wall biosynthesis
MNHPMRIWHVNVGNHAGMVDGVAVAATQLARHQAERGHSVRLVMGADPVLHDEVRAAAGPHLEVTLVDRARKALSATSRLLADPEERPDVVHLHSVFRPVHRILARRAHRLGIPVVLSPHSGLAPALLRRDRVRKWLYGELVERRFFRLANGVHALQLVERHDIESYCRTARLVAIIPNPVDPVLLRADPWQGSPGMRRKPKPVTRGPATQGPEGDSAAEGPALPRPQVVLLCRYDVYQKGLDCLAEIARLLPEADFRVYGHADKNAPERAAALIAAAPANLHFERPVHGDDKLRVLRESDVFMQPSRVEGLSVALIEAMALGVPCAVSSYVGRSLDMERQGTGLVLDDAPVRAAAQLAALLRDRSRQAALGHAARIYASYELDPDTVTSRHVAHYESLLTSYRVVTPATFV